MTDALLDSATAIALALLGAALVATFLRLAIGPSLADRVAALEMMAATTVAVATIYAVRTGLDVFIDVAMAIALVSFLGTVALSFAIEHGDRE